ncbi:MAG: phage capsid protein [Planctomycetes bacterium]|nr:phage capsid protein [Planctomycetota bacterium]
MPNADLNRLGLRHGGTEVDELFLTKFTSEVMSAFQTSCKFKDIGYTRTITEGKSARFDVLGEATARYRTAGEHHAESCQHIASDAFEIKLDGPLIANVMVDEWDEFLNHYDVRGRFAQKLGYSLAKRYDRNVATCGIKAARSSARIPGGYGGSVITDPTFATDAKELAGGIYEAAEILDDKDVPEEGRWCFVRPNAYYRLAQNLDLINNLYGGSGSVREGEIIKVAGITLVKTNTLPNSVIDNDLDKCNGDFTKTVALVMTNEAVGTVKRVSMLTAADWLPEYRSTLLVSEYLVGHDYFRPECAVELTA